MSSQIEQKITDKLQEFLNQIMTSENVTQIEDVQEASGWYKSTKDKDEFLSNVANTVITRLMENVSIPYVNLVIDKIQIVTSGKKSNVKFNASFEIDSLKPYIELVQVVNGKSQSIVKTVFQLYSKGSLIDAQILFKENSRTIHLEELTLHFEISIIQIGVLGSKYDKPRILGEKDYTLNLSSHDLQI